VCLLRTTLTFTHRETAHSGYVHIDFIRILIHPVVFERKSPHAVDARPDSDVSFFIVGVDTSVQAAFGTCCLFHFTSLSASEI